MTAPCMMSTSALRSTPSCAGYDTDFTRRQERAIGVEAPVAASQLRPDQNRAACPRMGDRVPTVVHGWGRRRWLAAPSFDLATNTKTFHSSVSHQPLAPWPFYYGVMGFGEVVSKLMFEKKAPPRRLIMSCSQTAIAFVVWTPGAITTAGRHACGCALPPSLRRGPLVAAAGVGGGSSSGMAARRRRSHRAAAARST